MLPTTHVMACMQCEPCRSPAEGGWKPCHWLQYGYKQTEYEPHRALVALNAPTNTRDGMPAV